jgi:hypothetical protein
MADLFYRVTAGADEASARNLLKSNSLLVELVCGQHSDLLQSDPQVAACGVARKMIKLHFSTWPESGYFVADKIERGPDWDFSGWNTLDCECRAVFSTNR